MATASAPDCQSPLTMRCMSRSRTRPVSEKLLFSRGPPPPPDSVLLASSTTSFTPGPRTSVAPDSSATSSPWSPPCFSSALRWRSPTSSRSESTSFWRSSAALVSASTRPISSWRSLATTGAVIRACAAPIVTTTAASTRPAASPSFARRVRGMPSWPSALRRAVASAYPSSSAWSITLVSSDMDASGRDGGEGVLRTGAAATCRTSSHVGAPAAEWPHRCAGRPPTTPPGAPEGLSDLRCPRSRTTRRAAPARRRRRAPRPTDG